MGKQFNIRDMPDRSQEQLQQLVEWTGYTKVHIMLAGLEKFWQEVKEEKKVMQNVFEFDAGGFNTRYELQKDGRTVKRTVLSCANGTPEGQLVNRQVSSWQWTSHGWKGQGSQSGQGYAVAKAFGFIKETAKTLAYLEEHEDDIRAEVGAPIFEKPEITVVDLDDDE